jgi:hypothetical protein
MLVDELNQKGILFKSLSQSGESLKFGANFLYYWTYRQKNGFKNG